MTRRFCIAVVLALGICLGLGASAGRAAPFTAVESAAYQEALSWWHAAPTGCTSMDLQEVPSVDLQDDARGEATQPEPGQLLPCRLWISSELSACELPDVMRHEVGHTLGLGHSEDPESIMHSPSPDWWCRSAQLSRQLPSARAGLRREHRLCRRYVHRAGCRASLGLLGWEVRADRRQIARLLALQAG